MVFPHAGPAKCLFEKPYFEKLKVALQPGGIICSQGKIKRGECDQDVTWCSGTGGTYLCLCTWNTISSSPWLQESALPLIKKLMTGCQSVIKYAFITIPTYPDGKIGMVLASLNTVRLRYCVHTVRIVQSPNPRSCAHSTYCSVTKSTIVCTLYTLFSHQLHNHVNWQLNF